MKQKSPWSDAHLRLKRLYDERVPPEVTQKEFGARYGIGSQSMVAQLLNGIRPLNYDTAAKFAKGLRCTIADISPKMEKTLRAEILPVLTKTLAVLLLVVPPLLPTIDAALQHAACVLCKILKLLHTRHSFASGSLRSLKACREFAYTTSAWLRRFIARFAGRQSAARQLPMTGASACSSPTSLPTWPMSTPISPRPFATH